MCIFFKNKIKIANNTDIMSTTVIKNAKLDSKIEIPYGFIGLIYYKEKHLFSLSEGSYSLKDENFSLVREKNASRNRKKSRHNFHFNIHFVTTNDSDIELTCTKTLEFKRKVNYCLKANFSIENSKIFANELLLTWYKTNNNRTNRYVTSFFKSFFDYIFKRKLNRINNEELYEIARKYFKKYGIKINRIFLSSDNQSNFFINNSDMENKYKATIPNYPEINECKTDHKEMKIINDDFYCSKCQTKQIKGAPFCHKCGAPNKTFRKD